MNNSYKIQGKHAILAALENPKRKIIQFSYSSDFPEEISHLLTLRKTQIKKIQKSEAPTKGIENQSNLGYFLEVLPLTEINIEEIIAKDNCKIAILDSITDPQNLGAILRSAAGFDIDLIALPSHNSAGENATVAKVASGALDIVPIYNCGNLNQFMKFLKENGFWCYGLDLEGRDLTDPKMLKGKIAVIIGSEGEGMRKLVKQNCDDLIKIPMSGKIQSLNASNAAAIIFDKIYNSR